MLEVSVLFMVDVVGLLAIRSGIPFATSEVSAVHGAAWW